MAVLFADTKSGSVAVTLIELAMEPAVVGAVATIVTMVSKGDASVPRLHVTTR